VPASCLSGSRGRSSEYPSAHAMHFLQQGCASSSHGCACVQLHWHQLHSSSGTCLSSRRGSAEQWRLPGVRLTVGRWWPGSKHWSPIPFLRHSGNRLMGCEGHLTPGAALRGWRRDMLLPGMSCQYHWWAKLPLVPCTRTITSLDSGAGACACRHVHSTRQMLLQLCMMKCLTQTPAARAVPCPAGHQEGWRVRP
jgi:hypothetical protein